MQFEWDEGKAVSNEQDHRVTFERATTVFSDPLSVAFYDVDHSDDEDRYLILGYSASQQLLVVSYKEIDDNTIRIISARRATRRERRQYEETS